MPRKTRFRLFFSAEFCTLRRLLDRATSSLRFPFGTTRLLIITKIRKWRDTSRGPQRDDGYSARHPLRTSQFSPGPRPCATTPSEPEQETLNSAQSTFWTRSRAGVLSAGLQGPEDWPWHAVQRRRRLRAQPRGALLVYAGAPPPPSRTQGSVRLRRDVSWTRVRPVCRGRVRRRRVRARRPPPRPPLRHVYLRLLPRRLRSEPLSLPPPCPYPSSLAPAPSRTEYARTRPVADRVNTFPTT